MRAFSPLVACLLIAGCLGQDEPADSSSPPTRTTPTAGTTPSTPTNVTSTPPTNATPTPTDPTPTPPPTATPTPTTPRTPPTPVTISIVNIAQGYAPASITVPRGTNVTWTNNDSALRHTATEDTTPPAWDTGTIASRGNASIVMNTTGTFSYHCALHPVMKGTITVQ